MDDHKKLDIIQQYIKAYNSFDIDGMLAALHPDIEFKNISGGEVNAKASGIEEFRELAERSKKGFSSRNQKITGINLDEDKIVVEIAFEGVLASDLPNGMKTGANLRLNGHSEFSFLDGKIVRITDIS